jgi:Na+-transporting NADH:ubiquinone oxidoreductase subunit C
MKEKILMIVFVIVVGSVLTAGLIVVSAVTNPVIEANNLKVMKMSVLSVLELPYSEGDLETVFSENVDAKTKDGRTVYVSKSGEVAFSIAGSGLWGPVEGVMGLKSDLKTVKRILINHQEETPGLGSRIADDNFLSRFDDKTVVPSLEIVAAGKAAADNQIDGITGATLSGKALEAILNNEIKKYQQLLAEVSGL